ncbi:MAG: hypothetical protein J0I86_07475 [Mesorhizobium sp.]|nr:hypothetical protein [Mesorhizobium sp.]
MLPNKRKPAVVETAGFQNLEQHPSKFDIQEDIEILRDRQATYLRLRFGLSLPVCRVSAELAFQSWRATA